MPLKTFQQVREALVISRRCIKLFYCDNQVAIPCDTACCNKKSSLGEFMQRLLIQWGWEWEKSLETYPEQSTQALKTGENEGTRGKE